MKTLIVYYSLEGNTEYSANRIAENIGADTLRLKSKKIYPTKGFGKFFKGGMSAVMGDKPDLEEYDIDLSSYERIIVGFPVWASNIAPPLRTFITDNKQELKDKVIATFACESGSGAEKAFEKLKGLIGIPEFEATAIFIDPKNRHTDQTDIEIDDFCNALK